VKTYWSYEVRVDTRCVCSAGDDKLSNALSRAISDCVYYQAVYPAAKITIAEIREACSGCHNAGEISKKLSRRTLPNPRGVKLVRCPECKGKGAHGELAEIPFVMPDPANRITLAQGWKGVN
jgi:hypothetical protein